MAGEHPSWTDWRARNLRVPAGPAELSLHSTGQCNLSCFMCWHGMVKEIPVTFTPAQLQPFLKRAGGVLFTGAEPLWHTKNVNARGREIWNDILAHHGHLRLHTLSNGVMLRGGMLETVLERFEQICFSVDSVDPAVYERVRGRDLLATVLKNMRALAEAKKAAGRTRHDPPRIEVNSVVCGSTLEGLPAVTETLAELGGESHSFTALQDLLDEPFGFYETGKHVAAIGDAANSIKRGHATALQREMLRADGPDKDRIARVGERLRGICRDAGIAFKDKGHLFAPWEIPVPSLPGSVCPMPWIYGVVTRNGDVTCCSTNSVVLGNVRRHTPEEIWNGPAAQKLRADFQRGEMTGCIKKACNAEWDHFKVAQRFMDTFARTFRHYEAEGGDVLLLRTGPLFQSHLAVKALRTALPRARVHLATKANAGDDGLWEGCEIHHYQGQRLSAEELTGLLSNVGISRFALALFVSSDGDGREYGNVASAVMGVKAPSVGWVGPDGAINGLISGGLK